MLVFQCIQLFGVFLPGFFLSFECTVDTYNREIVKKFRPSMWQSQAENVDETPLVTPSKGAHLCTASVKTFYRFFMGLPIVDHDVCHRVKDDPLKCNGGLTPRRFANSPKNK